MASDRGSAAATGEEKGVNQEPSRQQVIGLLTQIEIFNRNFSYNPHSRDLAANFLYYPL